jgi:LytS/YehU family sensor histidine kinase
VEVILGVLLGWAIAASVSAAFRLIRPPRVISDEQRAMQETLHAATATLPHLRRGLSADSAAKTVGHLLTLTQARAVALLDADRVLAFAGSGADHHDPSEWVALAAQPIATTACTSRAGSGARTRAVRRASASAQMLALHAPEGLGLRLAEDDLDAPAAPSSVMIER